MINFKYSIILVLFFLVPGVSGAGVGHLNMSITQDSYTDDCVGCEDTNYNSPSGVAQNLLINGQVSTTKTGFIKYDFVQLPDTYTILNAKLFFYKDAGDVGTEIKIYNITGTWEESTITYNTQPGQGTLLNTTTPIVGWNSVDITDEIKGQMNGTKNKYGLQIYYSTSSKQTTIRASEYGTYVCDDTGCHYVGVGHPYVSVEYVVTGINGYVTDVDTGEFISSAILTLTNSSGTDSSVFITTSNGYYNFDNLTVGTTYYLDIQQNEYNTMNRAYITTVNQSYTTYNIKLSKCTSGLNCFYNKHYVKFEVKNPFGTEYSDITVNVSQGGVLKYSNITGTDGSATFLLYNDKEYDVTFTRNNVVLRTERLYPKEDVYTIYLWTSGSVNRDNNVTYYLNVTNHNATTSNLILNFTSDISATIIYFSVYDKNNTLIYATSGNGTSYNPSFQVNDSNGLSYTFGFNATVPGYSTFGQFRPYTFRSDYLIDLGLTNTTLYTYIGLGMVFFVGMIFSRTTNRFGYVLVPFITLLTWSLGWYPQGYNTSHLTIIMTVLIIGIIGYLNSGNKRDQMAI